MKRLESTIVAKINYVKKKSTWIKRGAQNVAYRCHKENNENDILKVFRIDYSDDNYVNIVQYTFTAIFNLSCYIKEIVISSCIWILKTEF